MQPKPINSPHLNHPVLIFTFENLKVEFRIFMPVRQHNKIKRCPKNGNVAFDQFCTL